MTTARANALETLATSLSGRLIRPDDADYDAVRQVFIGGYDRRPAAIARVASADDAARVIEFARDTGVDLAVRSGGHSAAGHGTTEGGLVLDLRDLRSLDIDVDNRTVWAQTRAHRARCTRLPPPSTGSPSASATPVRSESAASPSAGGSATWPAGTV